MQILAPNYFPTKLNIGKWNTVFIHEIVRVDILLGYERKKFNMKELLGILKMGS